MPEALYLVTVTNWFSALRLYLSTFAGDCASAIAVCCLSNDIFSQKKASFHQLAFSNSCLQTSFQPWNLAWSGLRGRGSSVPDRPPVHQHWNGSVGATQAGEGGSQRRSASGEWEELPEPGSGMEHGKQVRISIIIMWPEDNRQTVSSLLPSCHFEFNYQDS